MEGRASHFFNEMTAILLEYVPEGFELDDEDSSGPKSEDEELQKELDVEADTSETIEADDTMKWEEEEEEEGQDDYKEQTSPPGKRLNILLALFSFESIDISNQSYSQCQESPSIAT